MAAEMLPQDCLTTILTFTSPQDAGRAALVSSLFRSATMSDAVWEHFLPSDYPDILSRAVAPLSFSSKKQLFLSLCDPLLIDGGTKSFKLEKTSGKKSYVLSARDLFITWSDFPTFWAWISTTESRFPEVAVLRTTSWLEIKGKIRTQMLSPNTEYAAYLILKISHCAYGFESIPSETLVEVGSRVSRNIAYLSHQIRKKKQMECAEKTNHCVQVPNEREDGWLEIELGQFLAGECDEEVKMSLMEVKGCQLKGGLVIDGIEVRPK